ncbi:MAG: hypothetical protein ABIH92_01640 [Nanoarchaeota archaeon]
MENVTLDQVNRNILLLRKEIKRVASIVEESHLEIDDEVESEVRESRGRDRSELISHEEMKKEFGDDDD